MTQARRRILLLCLGVSATTTLVQWNGASAFLDGLVGLPWSQGLVEFLRGETKGLVILVLFTLYFEFVGLNISKEGDRNRSEATNALLAAALEATPNRALMHYCLEKEYGSGAAGHLVAQVMRSSATLNNLSVRIRVRRTPQNDFQVTVQYSYEAMIPRYLIGVTDNPLHGEALLATGKLAEVFVVYDPTDTHEPPVHIDCLRITPTGPELLGKLNFALLSDTQKRALFKTEKTASQLTQLMVFEGRLPQARMPKTGDLVQYKVTHNSLQQPAYPYTFWVSDRVLYINSVEIDLSALGPATWEKARIQFFVTALPWLAGVTPKEGVWSFPLQAWLVAGQGFVVIWPGSTPREPLPTETKEQHDKGNKADT